MCIHGGHHHVLLQLPHHKAALILHSTAAFSFLCPPGSLREQDPTPLPPLFGCKKKKLQTCWHQAGKEHQNPLSKESNKTLCKKRHVAFHKRVHLPLVPHAKRWQNCTQRLVGGQPLWVALHETVHRKPGTPHAKSAQEKRQYCARGD